MNVRKRLRRFLCWTIGHTKFGQMGEDGVGRDFCLICGELLCTYDLED